MAFANTACVGVFSPLLPEIARAQSLADWQLGVLAGAFGFARMLADVPAGALAARRLGVVLAGAPVLLALGVALLSTGGPFPMLVLGRVVMGFGHTLSTVGGLTAILLDARGSVRLNTYEFAGMAGVLGGLAGVGLLPSTWGWPLALAVACSPLLISLGIAPWFARWSPDRAAALGTRDGAAVATASTRSALSGMAPIVWLMFGMGVVMGLGWSSLSEFLIPLRGTREFGLDRAGVSRLLAISQIVDLVALLPVGWLADRIGRVPVLSLVAGSLALGVLAVGLGSLPVFVAGTVFLGLAMAGWMLPLGVVREHTGAEGFARRTGLYRIGVDASAFLGPLVCGLVGEAHTGFVVGGVGVVALAASVHLGARALRWTSEAAR